MTSAQNPRQLKFQEPPSFSYTCVVNNTTIPELSREQGIVSAATALIMGMAKQSDSDIEHDDRLKSRTGHEKALTLRV